MNQPTAEAATAVTHIRSILDKPALEGLLERALDWCITHGSDTVSSLRRDERWIIPPLLPPILREPLRCIQRKLTAARRSWRRTLKPTSRPAQPFFIYWYNSNSSLGMIVSDSRSSPGLIPVVAALGLPLWAYWPISHEILTPKYYSAARWVPQRGTQVSLSPVSR